MIKLFITDMDGTLLHDDKSLPNETFKTIDACHQQNKQFCVASGRSYFDLIQQFASVKDEITLICNNGADIYNNDHLIYSSLLPKTDILKIKTLLNDIQDCIPIYVARNHAYIEKSKVYNQETMNTVILYYHGFQLIDDIAAIDDEFVKITICHNQSTEKFVYPHLLSLIFKYKVVISGQKWLDISNLDVNKGKAVENVRKMLGIKNSETVIYGDFLNDYEMFKVSQNAYAVSNAHPEIKAIASKIIASNQEDAVIKSIQNFLETEQVN